jgi:hypothetical protein
LNPTKIHANVLNEIRKAQLEKDLPVLEPESENENRE